MVKQSNAKSFTLVEILVVATIIVILSGTSVAMFSSYRDDKVLSNQVALLSSVIDLAKNKASAGDVSFCSNSSLAHISGYTVTIDSTYITLLPGCDTTPTPIQYQIPQNIAFITPSMSLQFNNINYQGTTRKMPIKNTLTNKCKYLQIDDTGLITNGEYTCP